MKCHICKVAEATIHIHEIINGKQTVIHLCENCANLKSSDADNPISLASLICKTAQSLQENSHEETVCPHCGWKLSQFRKMSRLGCAQCWETFQSVLADGLPSIHRGTTHEGLRPNCTQTRKKSTRKPKSKVVTEEEVTKQIEVDIQKQISTLQQNLNLAIEEENYEEAAKLRDQIAQLKKELAS